jgi:5-bromo-4-chloroindolyl phosphate hydrolysis protein
MLLSLHILAYVILGILAYIIGQFNTVISSKLIFAFFYIGLLQFIYVIPVTSWLKQKKQLSARKGMIIGSVVTALVNIIFLASWLFSLR